MDKKVTKQIQKEVKSAQKEHRRDITLDSFEITQLFPDITELLSSFTKISLINNQLSTLPHSLTTSWQSIKTLNLDKNAFFIFPSELASLSQLETLNLSQNHIELLPDLSKMTSLTSLCLSGNNFSSAPIESLEACINLRELDLSKNTIRSMESCCTGRLASKLASISLSNNFIEEIPMEVTSLIALKSLNISSNRISAIPIQLFSLKQLEKLDLSDNQISGTIPSDISLITKLSWLNISGNKLVGTLPISLSSLLDLKYFSFARNEITEIPKEFGDCRVLETIDASENKINQIPLELCALETTLHSFNLEGNPLCPELESIILKAKASTNSSPQTTIQSIMAYLKKLEQEKYLEVPSSISTPSAAAALFLQGNQPRKRPSQRHIVVMDIFSQQPTNNNNNSTTKPTTTTTTTNSLPIEQFIAPNSPRKWIRKEVETTETTNQAESTTNSPPVVNDKERGLKSLLSDPIGFQSFREFLQEEHSEENLVFWSDVERYRKMNGNEVKAEAKRLYERYISESSARFEINIPGTVKQKIKNEVVGESANPTPSTFDIAQNAVYDLMANDCFRRFVKTNYFSLWDKIRQNALRH